SPQTLLSSTSESVESTLWAAIRLFRQRANLVNAMAKREREAGRETLAIHYENVATEALGHAGRLQDMAMRSVDLTDRPSCHGLGRPSLGCPFCTLDLETVSAHAAYSRRLNGEPAETWHRDGPDRRPKRRSLHQQRTTEASGLARGTCGPRAIKRCLFASSGSVPPRAASKRLRTCCVRCLRTRVSRSC